MTPCAEEVKGRRTVPLTIALKRRLLLRQISASRVETFNECGMERVS
jgi:hypothetical protein